MTAKQEPQYDMFELVEKCLKANLSIFETMPAVKRTANRFLSLVNDIGVAAGRREAIGFSGTDKFLARTALAEVLAGVGGIIGAWAIDTGDNNLHRQVAHSKSDFKNMRDSDLKVVANHFKTIVDTHAADLEPFGLDADMRTDLEANIGRFTDLKTATRSGVVDRKKENAKLKTFFTAANKILNEQLDKLIRAQQKKHPELVAAYNNARIIVNNASRKKTTPAA
ncbi:hypothetical protein [Flaviaesturariibacter aridisoli]|uniref:Uncharacterized protein n=1 Tax=Flaviaesturariibacter aridisoli TaxID=2545761 RepID=A0A4R4DSG4_9BACT|nr:hypothetical protein [Flaviaesturariibacter aridisoli]TCZ64591.1 hypothetical protein E0486_18140 [Flaviaesturariibacter aridisoli]